MARFVHRTPVLRALPMALVVVAFGLQPRSAHGYIGRLEDPFRVNTVTKGSQAFPAVDSNVAGVTVVVWQCEDPDISNGICGQRFDSAGQPLGGEFRVNTFTAGVQTNPDVAVAEDGRFVVVWESIDQDGSGYGVYGQLFGTAGQKAGAEFRVNVATADKQRRPAVDAAADGRFVVVWEANGKDGSADAIVGRRYDAEGKPASGEFVVNSKTQGGQSSAAIAMAPDGRFVVGWETTAYPTGGGADVAARRFSAAGVAGGEEFLVHTFTNQTQSDVALAMALDGSFVAAWTSVTQDGSDHGVFAQRFSANGAKVGNEVQVNTYTDGIQYQPGVAIAGGGAAIVVWQDVARNAMYARCLGTNGQPLQGETLIEQGISGRVDVATDLQNDLFLVWQDNGPEIGARLGIADQDCRETDFSLCLNGNRFEVEVSWRKASGEAGVGHASELTSDTGTFWFFDSSNVEIVLKVLDACSFNGRYWVFLGGLTDVQVNLVVTDTEDGHRNLYQNAQGEPFELVRDTDAFALGCGAAVTQSGDLEGASRRVFDSFVHQAYELVASSAQPASVACTASSTALCLNEKRFRVEATFRTKEGQSGAGKVKSVTGDTGYIYFFEADNVEVMLKVLTGCSFNNRYWVFAAGLTDVEVKLTVTDTQGGGVKHYDNALGNPFELVRDTDAFSCN